MFYLIVGIIFLLGVSVGSFINAFEWRLYRNKNIISDRSRCRHCDYVLQIIDLVPILSFVILKAKCRKCKKKISWQYPLVELITGLFFVVAFLHVNDWVLLSQNFSALNSFELLREWIITSVLIFLFVFDIKYYLLPDIVTIPALIILIIMGGILYLVGGVTDFSWGKFVGGVSFGALFFYFQYFISKGKWIGGGDIRMGALMGAMLSWPLILLALFISYVVGSIISVMLLVKNKKTMKSVIPFGPFLVIGTFVALFWGQEIIQWYLKLYI